MNLRNSLYSHAKVKNIIILIIAAMSIYAVMNIYTFPIIQANAHGSKAFDMSPMGYSFEYAKAFLNSLSHHSRNIYLFIQEPLDIFYPPLTSLFFILLFARLSNKNSYLPFLGLIPLIFDYTENILVIRMLSVNNISSTLVKISSTVSIIKSFAYTACYCLAIILLFICVLKYFRRKKKYATKQI